MKIEINTKTDFTPSQIRDLLNEKFKCKKTKVPFNDLDVAGYIRRGKLPELYGGNLIKRIKIRSGFYLYRIENLSNE